MCKKVKQDAMGSIHDPDGAKGSDMSSMGAKGVHKVIALYFLAQAS
jgi:hypothetical protein